MEQKVQNTIESLKRNNIAARYFDSSKEAVEVLLKEINADKVIGIGGSMTIKTLELDKLFVENGNEVCFHWLEQTPEKMEAARRKAAVADIYFSSANAITEKGQLVNTDGVGNRVAAMIYGPAKVIIIIGINKITSNLDTALERIKNNAYKNARRLKLNTPCSINEKCSSCNSPQRMCNVTTIIDKKPSRTEMEVIIIGEELGF